MNFGYQTLKDCPDLAVFGAGHCERVMQERRGNPRRRVLKAGTIAFGQAGGFDCMVRNLSEKGACLEVASPVGIPDSFTLVVPQDAIMRTVHVQWRQAKRIGVVFE